MGKEREEKVRVLEFKYHNWSLSKEFKVTYNRMCGWRVGSVVTTTMASAY